MPWEKGLVGEEKIGEREEKQRMATNNYGVSFLNDDIFLTVEIFLTTPQTC